MSAALRILTALASGLIFGLGLALSGMLDPARVRGFLDVAGAWDPSLVFVLGGAVTVSGLGYLLSRRRARPVLASQFDWPSKRRIDAPLVAGAALFGIGWGLSGFCPGPAVAALSTGARPVLVFVAAMLAGMALHDLGRRVVARRNAPHGRAPA
ncbi:YeeE/YedE family protein [Methylobacterium sp. PvR107]|uniref:YeeE/YedE family protein n=1 Tax=Methylobacterium sp. PvR107 TaxID=2806597 RepID=UPI001AE9A427|nr:YeeE/YedE family protein [Methylobacterium sp. PvR107]MBP1181038.1 putative membrane protein YedE/YeeE [Methylobacterium sp. PvR107]